MIRSLSCMVLLCVVCICPARAGRLDGHACNSSCQSFMYTSVVPFASSGDSSDDSQARGAAPETAKLTEQDYRINALFEQDNRLVMTLAPLQYGMQPVRLMLEKPRYPVLAGDGWTGKVIHAQATTYGWMLRNTGEDRTPLLLLLDHQELQPGKLARIE